MTGHRRDIFVHQEHRLLLNPLWLISEDYSFSGKTQIVPLTQLIPMTIAGKTIVAPLLYSDQTPINLLEESLYAG